MGAPPTFFSCYDCDFRCTSESLLSDHVTEKRHRRRWVCVPCMVAYPSEISYNQHCNEVDIPAHRYCTPCNILFSALWMYHAHHTDRHNFLTPLVSPEAAKVKEEVARERREVGLSDAEKARREKRRKLQELEEKWQAGESKRREADDLRQELKSMGPVECALCARKFGTPGDYAQHLESGTHHTVKRQNVTQAVHMLDVIPPITLAATIQYPSSAESDGYTTSTITPFSSVPSSPIGGASEVELDSPIREVASLAGPVVLASSASSVTFATHDSRIVSPTRSPFEPAIEYTPNDFAHLGIPYACALCFKTFRTVVQLTAHMNSPVHDPDAFKCPGPNCGRQFALVSGLIQHLESGRCKLASAGEIFERFAMLTANFSKYLAV